jgi:hypothetical protein
MQRIKARAVITENGIWKKEIPTGIIRVTIGIIHAVEGILTETVLVMKIHIGTDLITIIEIMIGEVHTVMNMEEEVVEDVDEEIVEEIVVEDVVVAADVEEEEDIVINIKTLLISLKKHLVAEIAGLNKRNS